MLKAYLDIYYTNHISGNDEWWICNHPLFTRLSITDIILLLDMCWLSSGVTGTTPNARSRSNRLALGSCHEGTDCISFSKTGYSSQLLRTSPNRKVYGLRVRYAFGLEMVCYQMLPLGQRQSVSQWGCTRSFQDAFILE